MRYLVTFGIEASDDDEARRIMARFTDDDLRIGEQIGRVLYPHSLQRPDVSYSDIPIVVHQYPAGITSHDLR